MTLTLRHIKGAPLTIEEMDTNFEGLDTRIKRFEEQAGELESIAEVVEEEGNLRIIGSKGTSLGTIPIPPPKLSFKGIWQGEIPYFTNDIIAHDHKVYICKIPNGDTNFTPGNWSLIFDFPERNENRLKSLPVFEPDSLPPPEFGTLALLNGDLPALILGDGEQWQQITTKPLE